MLGTDSRPYQPAAPPAFRVAVGYVLMLLATAAAFLLVRAYGETLSAPAVSEAGPSAGATDRPDILPQVLGALAALLGPEASALVLPPEAAPFLGVIAQLRSAI